MNKDSLKFKNELSMMVHAYNPSPHKAGAGELGDFALPASTAVVLFGITLLFGAGGIARAPARVCI